MSPFDIWKALDEQNLIGVTEVERISREIAHLLGCKSNKDQEILQCMRERPLSDIMALYSVIVYLDIGPLLSRQCSTKYMQSIGFCRMKLGAEQCNRYPTASYRHLNNSYPIPYWRLYRYQNLKICN